MSRTRNSFLAVCLSLATFLSGCSGSGGVAAPLSVSATLSALFTYSPGTETATRNAAITPLTPSISIQSGMSWSVLSPALPAGLTLNSSTGVITGTPTVSSTATTYTVAVDRNGSRSTGTFILAVNDLPPVFTYTTNPLVTNRTVSSTPDDPINTGGATISYSVSPALPSGLSLNTSTGRVSGTPTVISAATDYTITATNTGGSATRTLNLTVTDAPPAFTYSSPTASYTRASAITANTVVSTGGVIVSFSISPALPTGLALNTSTGAITGTPSVVSASATYTVTGTNAAGSSSATVSLTVNDIPPSITYSVNPASYTKNNAIAANVPTNAGGTAITYSVSPSLPAGLSLNTTTGQITGTPTALAVAATYTVTATNSGGSGSVGVNITVKDQVPAITYSSNPAVYVNGTAITANTPTNTGGAAISYSVSPALPAGLVLSTSSGVITGTPTVISGATAYTVTATNTGGSSTVSVNITVNDVLANFYYPTNPGIYTMGSPIANNDPVNTAGTPISYAVSPALPAGLLLNTTTGRISGTPTALSSAASYTVTASTSGGPATTSVTITVKAIAPAFTYTTNPATYATGSAITANNPASTGGAIVSYSVSPALPSGLSLNTSTGVITGTPTAVSAATTYTVTATNTGGTANVSLSITVNDVVPSLTYSANPATYQVGSAIASNTPTNTGGAVVSYSVSPALPAGLALNTTTGLITGTPSAITSNATYTVTGTNSGGSATVGVQIRVNDIAPAFTYSTNPAIYVLGSAITTNTISSTGGTIVSFSVSPALPAGLSLNTSTGAVTGTPTAVAANATYTVTATNTGGTATVGLVIRVNDTAPVFTYSSNPANYTRNSAITTNTVSSTGGAIVSFSVSPALPTGLSLSTSTGAITGTPTAVTASATYTVTGTNSGGSGTVGVQIAVNDIVPVLTYSTNPATYVIGTAITSNTPTNTGGPVVSYSVSPALPAGLSLNTSTGVITGTPSAVTANATYTVTGTNSGGSANVGVQIRVNDIAPAFTYSTNPAIYVLGSAITTNTISSTGGTIVSFSVSPALPAGLSLNTSTGSVTGTPSAVTAGATYTVTATNTGGTGTAGLVITINDTAPVFTYSSNPAIYTRNSAITTNTVSSTGGAIVSFSVSPALPTGLSLNTSTGAITGTPTAVTANATYTVTGTNSGGSGTVGVQIVVNDIVPALTYSTNPATYQMGSAITSNTPTNTGGPVVSYSVSPALPAGLSLNTSTGVITGTPTAVTANATYTVTGTNSGGSANVGVQIRVNSTAPAFTYATNPATYVHGFAITANTVSSTGGAIVSFSVSPALPAGLSLNTSTGSVTGTPSAVTAGATYTVTATNTGGTATVGLVITVNDGAPSFTYASNPASYNKNVAITANTVNSVGGAIVSFAISPSLPTGFTFNTSTGTITGTPTALLSATAYTVTATNSGGSTPVSLNITVLEQPPGNLNYSQTTVTYPVDVAIINNTPSATGGPISSYSVSPALPSGLSLNTSTGVISGTPTAISSSTTYTVTATNSGGSTTKALSIAVQGLAPALSSIFPTGGSASGGTPVTITGNYFQSGATVTVGGSTCSSAVVVSGTKITCSTGSHADGATTVTVTNSDAQSGSLTNGFLYSAKVWLGGAAQSANAWSSGGSPATGSGDGMLASTLGHYPGPDGYIYVVDNTGMRIAKFDASTGAFIGWIGKVNLSPTGGAAGCTSTAFGSATPGWCTGGSSQTGNGDAMFDNPNDATVDTNGYLYVSDTNNNRVQKFDAVTGALIGWIGNIGITVPTGGVSGCSTAIAGTKTPGWCTGGIGATGTGDGMFAVARAVRVDPNTNILYVADRDNNRIQKFNATTGAFLGWIGRVKTTVSMTCTGGTPVVGSYTPGWCTGGTADTASVMTGDGTLNSPRGVSTDSTYLYVMETNGFRVDRYKMIDGTFQGWVGRVNSVSGLTCATGTPTTGVVTPSWCTGGTSQTGTTGDGMISGSSRGVFADSVGNNLFIGDFSSSRIERFNLTTGTFTGWIGYVGVAGVPTGGDAGCTSATVGAMTPGWCTGGMSAAGGGIGQLNGAAVVTMDPSRVYLYVSDNSNARINRYNLSTGASAGSLGAVTNVAPSWIANGVPVTGTGDAVMSTPYQTVTDGTYIYVSDSGNHRIQKFNASTGAFVGWIGNISSVPTGGDPGCSSASTSTFTPGWCTGGTATLGTGAGMMNAPMGLAVKSSVLYVADSGNNRISSYNTGTGAFLGWIGQLNGTAACGQSANAFNGGWCTTGTPAATAASSTTDGRMTTPRGVAVDSTYLYVTDSGNSRVYRFTLSTGALAGWTGRTLSVTSPAISVCTGAVAGSVTPSWCSGGTSQVGTTAGDGTMNGPYGISVDASGDILVADTGTNRVNWYNASGVFQGWLGRILTTGGTCTASVGSFTGGFCKGGTSQVSTGASSFDGLLNAPRGVAFDSTGAYIYIADTGGNRVQKYQFSSGLYGSFVGWQGSISVSPTGGDSGCSGALAGTATAGWCTGGNSTSGNGNGMFNTPAGLSLDSSHLFIGDTGNFRIVRITP